MIELEHGGEAVAGVGFGGAPAFGEEFIDFTLGFGDVCDGWSLGGAGGLPTAFVIERLDFKVRVAVVGPFEHFVGVFDECDIVE